MRTISALLLSFIIIFLGTNNTEAQTMELLAGNTLNGAVNGTLLGGATMAINNDPDFRPLQVGVGLGTLYGLGMGGYDVATGGGQELLVSGLFNDGNNTSILVLLDTFYGAAAGAVIGTSIMLIADRPIVEGLQYGTATGAWIGFGTGLIDVAMFSERRTISGAASKYTPNTNEANGLVGIQFNQNTSIGLVSPSVIQTLETDNQGISRKISASVDVLSMKVSF